MSEASLQARIDELEQQLSVSEQTLGALARGEIDTVAHEESSTPVLLKAAQGKLIASERLFRAVFDGAMDAMLIATDKGYYVDANPAACVLFGLSRDQLVGRSVAEVGEFQPDKAGTWGQFLTEGQVEGHFALVRPDGTPRDIDLRATANILPGLSLSVIQDITERKRAQDELHASEGRYRRIVENTSEGVWMYDVAGNTTFMNARMTAMLGCTLADAVGQPIYVFMDESGRKEARLRGVRRTRGVAERGDFRLKRRDGTDLWVSLHADPLFDLAGTFEGSLALLTDISERRDGEETRKRLASIVASSDDAIISRGMDGIIRTWNRGAERLTLYSADEAVGQSIAMLYPPGQAVRLELARGVVDGGGVLEQFEMFALRKDGTLVEISLTTSLLTDDEGEVRGASIIARDITERRRSEAALRRSEEKLRQAQKMEAVGCLAGGIAHDFNNVLSVILGYTSMLVDDLKQADPLRADLEQMHGAGLRAAQLTRQLLAFSRQQVLEPVVIELNQVVTGVEQILVRLLREDIHHSFLISPLAGKVHADPGQIEQVLMNLVVNARDAMPNGGHLTIETGPVMIDEGQATDHSGITPGPYVMLSVTDTGTGMDAATKERIFEPFFTTKDKSKGTGLGLSTVYGIIQQSGGHISVVTEPGKGTTFKVYLPRTERPAEAVIPPLAESPPARGAETILLVEDEEPVRDVMRAILRKNGYTVLEAQNGGEAFLLCEQFAAKIDILLTDVVMPRMSGRQLAERLAKLRPEMKVLYVSGYTDDAIVHHGVLDAGIAFLQKPILPPALLKKVRQVLDFHSVATRLSGSS